MKPIVKATLAACFVAPLTIGVAGAQTYRSDYYQPGYQSQPTYRSHDSQNYAQTGVVQSIETVRGTNQGNRVAGTILGGVIGGVLGHQIGSGRGNDAATVAGALGGAALGHGIARDKGTGDAYRVTIRMDNGETRVIEQGSLAGLRSGDRVRVDGDAVTLYAGENRNSYPVYQGSMPPPPDAYEADDRTPSRYDDRSYGYEQDGVRTDDRGYRYDRDGNLIDDEPTYRSDDRTRSDPMYRNQ